MCPEGEGDSNQPRNWVLIANEVYLEHLIIEGSSANAFFCYGGNERVGLIVRNNNLYLEKTLIN